MPMQGIYAAEGGQFNGNVVNYSNETITVTGNPSYGTWYGPNPGGQFELEPNSSAGYSQTSSHNAIDTTITITNTATGDPVCTFYLHYDSGGYWSNVDNNDDCQINPINNCDSCLNLTINSVDDDSII